MTATQTSRRVVMGLAGALGAILIWQWVATAAPGAAVASPLQTLQWLSESSGQGQLWESVGVTLLVAGRGFLLAVVVGIPLGILIGWFPLVRAASRIPIEFLKPIPPIVIMPSVILVLGPTEGMAQFLIFYGCVLPIIYQTAAGVKEVDPVAVETGRSYGMSKTEIVCRIVFPSAGAFIGTALRIAMPTALIVAVVAGLLGGGPGLGHDIFMALGAGEYPHLYGLVIVLGVLGLLIQVAGQWLERRLLHWHASYRMGV